MALFQEELIAQVRDRADIAQLIGERIALKPAGRNLKGLCPFHSEKTPSFMVSPEKQIFHCFGCGTGGNIFHFFMKLDGLSFPDAVRKIAGHYGIPLPQSEKGSGAEAAARLLLKLNHFAARFYQTELNRLAETAPLKRYLKSRGLKPESTAQFGLGWAPEGGDGLFQALKKVGAPLEKAAEVGLIRTDESGRSGDFFRGRLIFPITDIRGRIVGFGGRSIQEGASGPKYLNSPDTKVFHKGTLLYGLWQAKNEIKTSKEIILVEGYMDVISLHQAGFKNAVAPLGTALTDAHIESGRRMAERWTTFFDGDEAGARATRRALDLFLAHNIVTRTFPSPPDEDPDSLLQHPKGVDVIRGLKERAPLTFSWVLQQDLEGTEGKLEGRLAAVKEAESRLKRVTDPLVAQLLAKEISSATGVAERFLVSPSPPAPRGEATLRSDRPKLTGFAKRLMELIVTHPDLWAKVEPLLPNASIGDPVLEGLLGEFSRAYRQEGRLDIPHLLDEMEGEAIRDLMTELIVSSPGCPAGEAENALREILGRMVAVGKKRAMTRLTLQIREAEERKDFENVRDLVAKKQQILASGTQERRP